MTCASVPMQAAASLQTLHPGDVAVATRGGRMETLLGSCVAIILTDPRRTIGAMCHVVHARPAARDADDSTAHGDTALARMQQLLLAHGIQPALCEAWVIGGGNMFPGLVAGPHVGTCNAEWAQQALAALGVRIVGQDLGGNTYRRLAWTVGPGQPEVVAVPV